MLSNALKSGLWVLAATAVMGCFEPAPDSVFGVSQTPEWGGEPVNAGDGTKSVCVGVKPSPEAFKASPGPIMAPPEETETETEP